MPYKTDTKYSPKNSPTLYRRASLSDIGDPKILGFYTYTGDYLRKNGVPEDFGRQAGTGVSVGMVTGTRAVTEANCGCYFVHLDEILSEENAPPKHFRLTRITVDVGDDEGLTKFGYLLGARGYIQDAVPGDERYTYEVVLELLEPILIPPTLLLNLFDDCIAAQPTWGEEE